MKKIFMVAQETEKKEVQPEKPANQEKVEKPKKPAQPQQQRPVTIIVNKPGPVQEIFDSTCNLISSIVAIPLSIPMFTSSTTSAGLLGATAEHRKFYYRVNHDSIMKDIVKGGGEFLDGFNELLGMGGKDWNNFLKHNIDSLCGNPSYENFVEIRKDFRSQVGKGT